MKTTNLLALLLFVALFGACNKPVAIEKEELSVEVGDNGSAFEDFAIVLSKAAFNEPALRSFIKEEALKQFDRDYDVFYPFVRTEIVDGKRTFEEILSEYDEHQILPSILSRIPLLTILVPDWSWFDERCFSVHSWNASDPKVMVAFDKEDDSHQLIFNGRNKNVIPYGCFIDTPILVLKNNERMVEDVETKGPLHAYHFLNEAFDGSQPIQTKAQYEYDEHILSNAGNPGEWETKMNFSQKIRDCYQKTDGIPGAAQRDYVYYGMCATAPTGYIDNLMAESIYKYKINPYQSDYFETGDISFQKKTSTVPVSDDDLKVFGWMQGNLELRFVVNVAGNVINKFDNCQCGEAFIVKKVKEKRRLDNGVYTSYEYYVDENNLSDYLVPKWVYPDSQLTLFTWDISNIPSHYLVDVYEVDSGSTIVTTSTHTWQYMDNFTVNNEIGSEYYGLTMKTSFGAGTTSNSQSTSTATIISNKDDNLGSIMVQYMTPIVIQNALSGVKLNSYNSGKITVCMVPTLMN